MRVKPQDIFDFFELRIACHARSVNYFSSLFGYCFIDHDYDKLDKSMRAGYAHIFYHAYHRDFHLDKKYIELCKQARAIHHKQAEHHIHHYQDIKDIPDVCIYEMVADWASANFEQLNILHDPRATSLSEWVDKNMRILPWTKHQMEIIDKSVAIVNKNTDANVLYNIWQALLEKSNL